MGQVTVLSVIQPAASTGNWLSLAWFWAVMATA
jgi:hypothetical protein